MKLERLLSLSLQAILATSLALGTTLGQELAPDDVQISPDSGWSDLPPEKATPPLLLSLLSWLPDRLADAWDILRVDAGVGPGFGGTVRATRFLQASYREFEPGSLRIGALGRRIPIMWEDSSEHGVAPIDFAPSTQRDICTYEIGAGIELFAVGAYVGFCPEEAVDFLAGLFFLDTEQDDAFVELLQ
jgi:hypothetical protein